MTGVKGQVRNLRRNIGAEMRQFEQEVGAVDAVIRTINAVLNIITIIC